MSRLRRAEGVVVSEMEGDLFLVRPADGEIYHLDRMAAAIWNLLAEPLGRTAIRETFAEAFPEVPADRLAADLDTALETLIADGLLAEE